MFAISEDVVDLAARPPSLNAVGTPVVSAEDDSATAGRPGTARQTGDNGLFGPMALQRWQSEGGALPPRRSAKRGRSLPSPRSRFGPQSAFFLK